MFFSNIYFYGTYLRVVNTLLLYFASTNVLFHRKNKISKVYGFIIFTSLVVNVLLMYFNSTILLKEIREFAVLIFLSLTMYNLSNFLIIPNRFDKALISAAVAGYLLIIEIAVRTFMILYLISGKQTLNNIDFTYHTKTFIDTVYYCTVTITSIGFGDILPISHNARMATSLFGLLGQLYLVIIMSIIISKFLSGRDRE